MKSLAMTILIGTAVGATACSKPETATTNQAAPIVAASPATQASATPDEIALARGTFQKDCAGCHGEGGHGGLKTVDGKKMEVPSFHEGHALNHNDEDFVKQIMNGDDGMPAFKDRLSPEQINDLVRFIRKEFQGK